MPVFSNNFVAIVKVNGKPAQEFKEETGRVVYLPFGSEYTIGLKNMDPRRAAVSIEIDGKCVTGDHKGAQLVMAGNSEWDLAGAIAGYAGKAAFRFIEKTKEISEHRGDRIDDGLIRVAFRYEKPKPVYTPRIPRTPSYPYWWNQGPYSGGLLYDSFHSHPQYSCGGGRTVMTNSVRSAGPERETKTLGKFYGSSENFPTMDAGEGITVAGGDINQNYGSTVLGELETEEHVIIFQLRGRNEEAVPVSVPVIARTKVTCPTCGKRNPPGNKFCGGCTTRLV